MKPGDNLAQGDGSGDIALTVDGPFTVWLFEKERLQR
jgi:hypothetical protein